MSEKPWALKRIEAAITAERERCAKIAEDEQCWEHSEYGSGNDAACRRIAAAIREQRS